MMRNQSRLFASFKPGSLRCFHLNHNGPQMISLRLLLILNHCSKVYSQTQLHTGHLRKSHGKSKKSKARKSNGSRKQIKKKKKKSKKAKKNKKSGFLKNLDWRFGFVLKVDDNKVGSDQIVLV